MVTANLEGLRQCLDDAAAQLLDRMVRRDMLDEDREFVATQPGHDVMMPDQRDQSRCHRDEQRVADRVAERVVDELEPVEVETQHRATIAAAGVAHHLVEPFAQHGSVGKIGQGIVPRQMREARGRVARFGDVGNGVEKTAIDQPGALDRNGPSIRPALFDPRAIGGGRAVIFLDQSTMLVGRTDRQTGTVAEQLVERQARDGMIEPVYVEEPLIGQHQPPGRIEQSEPLVHVVERGLEPQVLKRAFRQRDLQLLRHQAVRAIRSPPVDIGFGIGRRHQREQAIRVDPAVGPSRAFRLACRDPVEHRRLGSDRGRGLHAHSPISVIVIV